MKGVLMSLGRIVFIAPFAVFGLFHFVNGQAMTADLPAWVPFKLALIYISGVFLILAFLFILFKIKYANVISLILTLGLLGFIIFIDLPGLLSGSQDQIRASLTEILKDTALMGAALTYSGIFTLKKG
jgi:putative oxidoreductase